METGVGIEVKIEVSGEENKSTWWTMLPNEAMDWIYSEDCHSR